MKNTFTFPHDYGARNDPELQRLLFEYGPEAGWAYWVLIEMLYEQGGRMPKASYPQVAYAAHVGSDLVKGIVEGSSLFESDKKYFWSRRVDFTLETKEEKSAKGRTAAQAKWAKWKKEKELQDLADADSMQTQSERTADAMPNNSNSNNNSNNNSIGSSLHSEPCPTGEQSDAEPAPIFPENKAPVERKPEVLSNKHCQQVVDFWNRKVYETGAQLPTVKTLSEERKTKIRIRWEEFSKIGDPVSVCRTLFVKATASKFLQGDNSNGWKASFDWLFTNGKNWVKVYEGNYDDTKPNGGATPTRLDALKNEFNKIDEIFGGQENGQQEQSGSGVDEQ